MTDRDRNARLALLASRAGRSSSQPPVVDDGQESAAASAGPSRGRPALSFRNYVPKDPSLVNASPPPVDDDDDGEGGGVGVGIVDGSPKKGKRKRTGESEKRNNNKSVLELALAKAGRESRIAAGQDVMAGGGWGGPVTSNAATRKVNWDLKRDVRRKMDKLERRTQRAIVELLRERLEREAEEGGGGDDDDEDDDDEEGDGDLD